MEPEYDRPGRPSGVPVRPDDTVDAMRPTEPRREQDGAGVPQADDEPPRAQRVVVGIDGSAQSRAALHWAVWYARQTGAEVHAVAVWHQPPQFGVGGMTRVPERQFEDEARGWLAGAMPSGTEASGVEVATYISRGEPATVLLDHALRADLLVVGNRGRGGLAGAMMGSVALRTAHHAHCPVVLIPAPPSVGDYPPR